MFNQLCCQRERQGPLTLDHIQNIDNGLPRVEIYRNDILEKQDAGDRKGTKSNKVIYVVYRIRLAPALSKIKMVPVIFTDTVKSETCFISTK